METDKIFIDMAQRAHEFAEMCRLMQKIPDMPLTAEVKDALDEYAKRLGLPKENHEAWREECRKKQAAGVRFQNRCGCFWQEGNWNFEGNKEDYREIQEAPKKSDVRIPEAARDILMAWQRSGLKFFILGDPVNFSLCFYDMTSRYTIPKQPIPEGMSVETVEAMWQQGLRVEFDEPYGGQGWTEIRDTFTWSGDRATFKGAELLKRLRIPAQPMPEKMLEVPQPSHDGEYPTTATGAPFEWIAPRQMPPPTPHAAERALWKAQREAGTNEVWQGVNRFGVVFNIPVDKEPGWYPPNVYRVKPMKLTAKICRVGEAYPMSYSGQDWQFTGTREEYLAECEKYGYSVISEIKEVKPKTVKYYFALMKNSAGEISVEWCDESNLSTLEKMGSGWSGHTIIGDIEEREIEA